MTDFSQGISKLFVVPKEVSDPVWQLKRDIAAQLRLLAPAIVTDEGTVETYSQLKQQLQDILDSLGIREENFPMRRGYQDGRYLQNPGWYEDRNPVVGLSSPLSPPLVLDERPEQVTGTVFCSSAYEGPPGNVHGGIIAAILDQALGKVAVANDIPVLTAQLTVKYRAPTPIETELGVVAKLDDYDGKKAIISGKLRHNGTVSAEATGIFVSMATKNFQQHLNSSHNPQTIIQ